MMSSGFYLPKGAFQVDILNWAFLLPPYKTKWALCKKKQPSQIIDVESTNRADYVWR